MATVESENKNGGKHTIKFILFVVVGYSSYKRLKVSFEVKDIEIKRHRFSFYS